MSSSLDGVSLEPEDRSRVYVDLVNNGTQISISFESGLKGKVIVYVVYVNEAIKGKGRRVGVYLRDKPRFADHKMD